jgi:molybdate transport system substrate-binding protein
MKGCGLSIACGLAAGMAWALAAVAAGAHTPGRRVDVAAAADLKFALDEIGREFGRKHPDVAVRVTYGSSGNFHAQIVNGAPFDLYFSADAEYPRRLVDAGLAGREDLFPYAIGRIVLWVPKASAVRVEDGLGVLARPEVRRVAIANPRHAPYGRAAEAALRRAGIHAAVSGKLVFGENVAQAAHFVQSGAADAGLIALSLARAPALAGEGRYFEVPVEDYPRMEQAGVILRRARDPGASRAFRDFVVGSDGRAILKRYGFALPGQ